MDLILVGASTITGSLVIHFTLWKYKLIPRKIINIVLIFLSCGLVALALSYNRFSVIICIQAGLLYLLTILVYLSYYTAIEKDSVSSLLLLEISKNDRISLEELHKISTNEEQIFLRLKDLSHYNFVTNRNGRFQLTNKGLFLLGIVTLTRKIFTNEKLGG